MIEINDREKGENQKEGERRKEGGNDIEGRITMVRKGNGKEIAHEKSRKGKELHFRKSVQKE